MTKGMYPNAHPTAPGGMSQADLRVELVERHGYKMADTRGVKWPDLIQMVIDARLAREAEAKELYGEADEDSKGADDMFEDVLDPDAEPTADDLLAEFDDLDDLDDSTEDDSTEDDSTEDDSTEDDSTEDDSTDKDHDHAAKYLPEPGIAPATPHIDGGLDTDIEVVEEDEVFDPETLFAEMQEAWSEAEAEKPAPIFIGIPGIKDYVFDGHAGAGPSASERWMHCTMSLSASRRFLETLSPNQQRNFAGANLAARQGTTAHAVGEAKANHMLGRIDDAELDNTLLDLSITPDEGEEYTDEMEEYVQEYVDLIKQYADERGPDKILIESRVEAAIPLADMHEGEVYVIRGSADVIALPTEDEPVLMVGDLKYGEGIYVDAEDNSQALIYALGALDRLTDDEGNLITDIETVRIYIAQPRLGGIKRWELSLDELFDWRDDVLSSALTKALYGEDEGATFNPGKTACQFCPARGGCPALTEQRVAQAAELFDVIVDAEYNDGPGAFPETTTLSNERLGELLTQISGLIDIHKDLKEEAQRRLHRGTPVPGYLLVNYSPPRKWKDGAEEKVVNALGRKVAATLYTEPKMMTPAQAQKALGEEYAKIEALVDKPDKRPVVAPVGDRRSEWAGTPPEAMFPDHEGAPDSSDSATSAERMFPDA